MVLASFSKRASGIYYKRNEQINIILKKVEQIYDKNLKYNIITTFKQTNFWEDDPDKIKLWWVNANYK
jgi:hypothetical protein